MSEMSPAEAVFFAALELPVGERTAFLDQACAGDDGLRARLDQMLAAQAHLGGFLDRPESNAATEARQTGPLAPQDEATGATIAGKYKLLQRIGEGGMGALAPIGERRPPNLIHVLPDNERHESTGGQATASRSADLAAVVAACGYPRAVRATSLDECAAALAAGGDELSFIHVKTGPGENDALPRPTVTPRQVAERFRAWLRSESMPR